MWVSRPHTTCDEVALPAWCSLQAGTELPDEVLVDLVLWGISQLGSSGQQQQQQSGSCTEPAMQRAAREVASSRRPGFVLDGFPATAAQAGLLHHRLTGRDLAGEEQLLRHGSQLLPELADLGVDRPAPFQAGEVARPAGGPGRLAVVLHECTTALSGICPPQQLSLHLRRRP
jgi:hypothetical protein